MSPVEPIDSKTTGHDDSFLGLGSSKYSLDYIFLVKKIDLYIFTSPYSVFVCLYMLKIKIIIKNKIFDISKSSYIGS